MIRNTVRAEAFLGGRMDIFPERSRAALQPIADHFAMDLEAAADSASRWPTPMWCAPSRLISTQRGYDPRDYVLVPFGGAGPLHAASVAEDLGIERIVVPPSAGVISAFGLLASDFTQYSSLTRRAAVDEGSPALLREVFAAMRGEAGERFAALGLEGALQFDFIADMRFVGQAFEVPVRFAPEELETLDGSFIHERFGEAHHKVYFFGGETRKPIEFVSFRLGTTLPLEQLPVLEESPRAGPAEQAIEIYHARRWQSGRLTSRADLPPGTWLDGPALLEDPTSTLFLPAGWRALRDAHDNTLMTRS